MATEASRLRRSRRNKMIFRVAGGLAERFHIDPAIIRIVFILLAFAMGSAYCSTSFWRSSSQRKKQSRRSHFKPSERT